MIDWDNDGEIDMMDIAITCAMIDELENDAQDSEGESDEPLATPYYGKMSLNSGNTGSTNTDSGDSGPTDTGSGNSGCITFIGIIVFGYLLLHMLFG